MGEKKRTKKSVYIAAPYTKGDVALNVRMVIDTAENLIWEGYIPYVPHLTHFWHFCYEHNWEFWLNYDFYWLQKCDYLLRLGGESVGADKEVGFAKQHNIPVYYSILELRRADENN